MIFVLPFALSPVRLLLQRCTAREGRVCGGRGVQRVCVCRPGPQLQPAHRSHARCQSPICTDTLYTLCEHRVAGMAKAGLLRVDYKALLLTAAITTANPLLRRATDHEQSPSWRVDTEMATTVRVFGKAARLHLCRRASTFAFLFLVLLPLISLLTRLSSNISGQH